MNILHNISDCVVNISYAEGFGLSTLEAMQTGTPIIATKTGGLWRQVEDHRDGTHNGIGLDVEFQSLVGSQNVPFIYEDYVSVEAISDALLKMYEEGPEGRKKLGEKARSYVQSEFALDTTIDLWHESLLDLAENWKDRQKPWVLKEI